MSDETPFSNLLRASLHKASPRVSFKSQCSTFQPPSFMSFLLRLRPRLKFFRCANTSPLTQRHIPPQLWRVYPFPQCFRHLPTLFRSPVVLSVARSAKLPKVINVFLVFKSLLKRPFHAFANAFTSLHLAFSCVSVSRQKPDVHAMIILPLFSIHTPTKYTI